MTKTNQWLLGYFVCECGRNGCWDKVPAEEYLILNGNDLWPSHVIIKKSHKLPEEKIELETENLCLVKRQEYETN